MVVKKDMSAGMMCPVCHAKCHGRGCRILCGILVAVAGLLMVWPLGWFTFERVFGILILLFGLKVLGGCMSGHCH